MTDNGRHFGFEADVESGIRVREAEQRRQQRRERRRQRRGRDNNPWTRLVIGLAILIVGVLAWLDHLGRIDANDFAQWWALILIALGLAHLPQRRWLTAGFYFILGLVFLPPLPFLPHFHLGEILGLWPLLISAAGVTLLNQTFHPTAKDTPGSGAFRAFAWMGGSGRTIASENFVGGDAIVVMGACELNLANARIANEAVIDVLAFWGGIEIRVPPNWTIENHVTVLLGGIGNHATNATEGDGPRLIIRGSVIMGGIEIRNPKEIAS